MKVWKIFIKPFVYNYLLYIIIILFFLQEFKISRNEANGGDLNFNTYEELEICFSQQNLHPADLKTAVEFYINRLLDPIRKIFDTPELQKLVAKAYPAALVKSKKTGKIYIYIFLFSNK